MLGGSVLLGVKGGVINDEPSPINDASAAMLLRSGESDKRHQSQREGDRQHAITQMSS